MAAPPLEIQGKSYPMTVLTPVRRVYRLAVVIFLKIFSWLPLTAARKLKFIHFAGWTAIRRDKFPRLSDEQPEEELKNDYFLFMTNFNGSWDQYIDAFGMIGGVRTGLDLIWKTSTGFPGAWPIRPFKRYIHYYEYPMSLYYNAYPGMSVRDIDSATKFVAALDEFEEDTADVVDPVAFETRFKLLLNEVAANLGNTGGEGAAHEVPSLVHSQPRGLQL